MHIFHPHPHLNVCVHIHTSRCTSYITFIIVKILQYVMKDDVPGNTRRVYLEISLPFPRRPLQDPCVHVCLFIHHTSLTDVLHFVVSWTT